MRVRRAAPPAQAGPSALGVLNVDGDRGLLASSVFRDALAGFQDRALEDEYQVQQAADARMPDAVADTIFTAMAVQMACQMWSAGGHHRFSGVYFGVVTVGLCFGRSVLLPRWALSRRRASWRVVLMAALRLEVLSVSAVSDTALGGDAVMLPGAGAGLAAARNMLFISRVPAMWMLSLSQRLPFRAHALLQLPSAASYAFTNWRLCGLASTSLRETFRAVARSLTRAVAASLLLPPPPPALLPERTACSAVSTLAYLLIGSLLPTAFLLYTETKCRMEFLRERQESQLQPQQRCLGRAAARERLGREASLAAFPLLVASLTLPLTGLLWNLLLHAHRLL